METHRMETEVNALAALTGASELEIYRRIFYASPDYIAFSRLSDGCFIDVNPGFERLLGFRREEVIGKTSYEVGIWPEFARPPWEASSKTKDKPDFQNPRLPKQPWVFVFPKLTKGLGS